jgi:3-dehydroquinate dehydratase / shikimate dehydrogenase
MNQVKRTIHGDLSGTFPGRRSTAALVACLSVYPVSDGLALTRAARGAGWLLIRADCIGELSAIWLRTIHPWRFIYALRTRAHGGHADPADPDRATRLREAAVTHDLVEVEAPRDLIPDVLAAVPAARRLVTWRGPAESGPALASRLKWLTGLEAAAYQLVVACHRSADGIAPLEALIAAGRRDVVAYAAGEAGLWSRVLSPLLGSPFVFGSLNNDPDACEPSVARLVDDFGLPDPGPVRRIFGIVGDPVSHSLSPRLHNACYRAAGVPAVFLPFTVEAFGPFWDELVASGALERLGLPLGGLTVSSPNKEMAVAAVSAVAPAARRAGSANLVYRRGSHWVGDTTDPAGVLETLGRRGIAVAGRRAAVVGCGGSGRAIASALARAGANVVLSNRGRVRGEMASRRLGLPLVDLTNFSPRDFNLIVNATPVGRTSGELPFACDRLGAGTVIVDLVYAPRPTSLAVAAEAGGTRVISGHEVLLVQATRQFEKMTGRAIPVELMAGQVEHHTGILLAPKLRAPQEAETLHLVGALSGPMALE